MTTKWEAAQAAIDKAARDVQSIQELFIDGKWVSGQDASERLSRLKDEWDANLRPKGPWVGTPAELTMKQAAAEVSQLRRNSRPTTRWVEVLDQVHGTLKLHPA